MKNGFSAGKILGINIYIDWSWLFIFALVSWSIVGLLRRKDIIRWLQLQSQLG